MQPPKMLLLIDENVPRSVTEFFKERGHEVRLVLDILLPGTPDPVIATIGDRMSALVVTWDKDFDALVARVPKGNQNRFRRLGRISLRGNEARGRQTLERWIELIEFHYEQGLRDPSYRMIVSVSENGCKFT
jgi:predicted nuclease of predicted toxin-antitoxin system